MYQQMYPHLFSPLRIKKITFRNRIFSTPNTSLSDLQSQIMYFEKKAIGGAAQVSLQKLPLPENIYCKNVEQPCSR